MNWEDWLNETVTWDLYDDIPRRTAIYRLCKMGLIPFLASHGYVVEVPLKLLGSRIATGLYMNRGRRSFESNWEFGYQEARKVDCPYKVHYAHVIDTEEWHKFWKFWGTWHDVDAELMYGIDRQYDIQEYMWTQISQDKSHHTRIVDELLGIEVGEDVSEYENRDTYLKESAESNEWGGRRK